MELLRSIVNLLLVTVVVLSTLIASGYGLQCYQCDSNEDYSCPSWQPFDRNINALVDCMSFEARTPGTFCLKITRQSPGWFGWIKQTRRCGSRSDTGVAWGCRWVFEDNGVWKETCYCEDRDGCNTAAPSRVSFAVLALIVLSLLTVTIQRIISLHWSLVRHSFRKTAVVQFKRNVKLNDVYLVPTRSCEFTQLFCNFTLRWSLIRKRYVCDCWERSAE
jgi:hypothetical protein